MPEAPPPPEGATTIPPADPRARLAAGTPGTGGAGGVTDLRPKKPRAKGSPVPGRAPGQSWRRPASWWLRHAVPFLGLALFVGCLGGLLVYLSAREAGSAGRAVRGSTARGDGAPSVRGGAAVVIDPGHGGIDTGAIALGLQEKALNLDVATRVAQALASRGVTVRMTRTSDRAVSLEDRVRIANGTPGAIFVSIHFNDAPTTDRGQSYHASGVETYYSEHKEGSGAGGWLWTSLFGGRDAGGQRAALAHSAQEGAALADDIQGSLVLATSAADRGIKERALYVTRRVRGPAVLVEGGFISHPTEARRLAEPAYRQKLAEAVAAGILKYLQGTGRTGPAGS